MNSEKKSLETVLREIEIKHGIGEFQRMIAGAYALWLARKNDQVDIVDLKEFLKNFEGNVQVRLFVQQQLDDHWDKYRKYITSFNLDTLKEFIIDMPSDGVTSYIQGMPEYLKKIVTHILDIKSNDYVADFGAGAGDFLCYAQKQVPQARYWGDEIGSDAYAIAKIRSLLIGGDHIEVVQEDMFSGTKSGGMKFDKAFCFPPFGMRLGRMPNVENFLRNQPASLPIIKGTCSGEWLFALKMLSCLKEHGRAVLVMPIGGLFNQLDNTIRKYFLEHKLIEMVVKLPNRVLDYTAIPVALIVFSSKNNEKVHLIDASGLGQKNRKCTFSCDDVEKILSAINGEHFPWTTYEHPLDLVVRGNMDPAHYTREEIIIPYEDKFECAIEEIFRGALISSSELDAIKSEEKTNFRYLTPTGIQNGVICDELPYLSEGAEKYKRYSLQNGDLVITKNGSPFKVAIAEISSEQTVIVNGNIFVIRLKKEEADRFYIKAFLESDKGQAILQRASVGSTMPMLTINALKSMSIALPPFEQQKAIGAKYLAKMDEIAILKQKLDRAVDALGGIISLELGC